MIDSRATTKPGTDSLKSEHDSTLPDELHSAVKTGLEKTYAERYQVLYGFLPMLQLNVDVRID